MWNPIRKIKEKQNNILISEREIAGCINILAKRIESDYSKKNIDELHIIFVLNGSFMFTADLIRELSKLNMKLSVNTIKIKSYIGTKSKEIEIDSTYLSSANLDNKDILIIDDILDTGKTLNFLKWNLFKHFNPKSVEFCCLLQKNHNRRINKSYLNVKYIGFIIPDEFVIGYGLDHNNKYREFPYITIYDGDTN